MSFESLANIKKSYYPQIAVISKVKHFIEYRNAIVDSLRKKGFSVESHENINQISEDIVVIIIVNPLQYLDMKFNRKKIYYAIQTEQLISNTEYSVDTGFFNYFKLLKISKKYNAIYDWSIENCKTMSKYHPNYYHFPYSIYPELKHSKTKVEEVYDIAFIGWDTGIDNRRKLILQEIEKHFNVFPKYNDLWGLEKENALSSSKIILNIHFDHSYAFESPRFYEYLYNEKFLLSEKVYNSYPFEADKDYATFDLSNILEKITFYLENPNERNMIAKSGYKKSLNMHIDLNIDKIIDRISLDNTVNNTTRTFKVFLTLRLKNLFIKKLIYMLLRIFLFFKRVKK